MAENASIIDPVDDPDLDLDAFFRTVRRSLLRNRPIPILHMRHQGSTFTCYANAVTAAMYGEEVSRVGRSDEGSTQEFMDNIHKHERPRSVETDFGPFDVPPEGFPCSYPVSFGYAIKYGVCKSSDYPWTGVPKSSTYSGATWDGKVVAGTRTVPIDREAKISIKRCKELKSHGEIESYLEKQPVAACIMLTDALYHWSSEDIYKGVNAGANLEKHAITLVGYGNDGDDHYYLCQNSYGLGWGHRGYFKAARNLIKKAFIAEDTESPVNRKKMNKDAADDDAFDDTADVDAFHDAGRFDRMGSHALKRRRTVG